MVVDFTRQHFRRRDLDCGFAALSWYTAHFGSYNKTYGSLGAAVGFMTWIWISTVVILTGAKINAELEHQTGADTIAGTPAPRGERDARRPTRVGRSI